MFTEVSLFRGSTATIDPGETAAVVGATGSGKSTLAALIAGIYQPSAGNIIHAVDPHRVVTVTQETHVFTGTVRENLTLTAATADDDQLNAAAQAAIAGRAALVIAHQLSQAAAWDCILVMDASRIIEQGNHDSLVAAQDSYANLWAAWSQQH